jgi:hypothetical protein
MTAMMITLPACRLDPALSPSLILPRSRERGSFLPRPDRGDRVGMRGARRRGEA